MKKLLVSVVGLSSMLIAAQNVPAHNPKKPLVKTAPTLNQHKQLGKTATAPVLVEDEKEIRGIAFTLKNGYFVPQEKVLRDIFDRKGGVGGYWVEGAVRYEFWKKLNAELSGSYFERKGIALCGNECTEVKIPTLGLGLKYFFECNNWLSFFLGGGLRVFFYREKNYSQYVQQCVNETVAGGMVNLGVEFDVYKGLFIDLFADYNGGKTNLNCNKCCSSSCCDINVGGFVGGIGLGYKF